MRKLKIPHWIIHSHFLASDEYECSECGKRFRRKTKRCPGCGAVLRSARDDLGWVDEEEELSIILEDD